MKKFELRLMKNLAIKKNTKLKVATRLLEQLTHPEGLSTNCNRVKTVVPANMAIKPVLRLAFVLRG